MRSTPRCSPPSEKPSSPRPPQRPAPRRRTWSKLVGRRAQLVATRTAELNRAAHYTDKLLRQQSRQLLALLDRQIERCDRAIAAQIAADAPMKARAARVQQLPGIGPVVAAVLQAQMPELGTLSEGEAAARAGLAPYNRDSGPWKGTRHIPGRTCLGALRALSGGAQRGAPRPDPQRVLHQTVRGRQKTARGADRRHAQAGGAAQSDAAKTTAQTRAVVKFPPKRPGFGAGEAPLKFS
jgi:transposase